MDAVVTTLIGAAPQLGVAGVLLALLGVVIRWGAQDRTDSRTQIAEIASRHAKELADLTARHAAELVRVNTDHDTELAELRVEIRGLRVQFDEVNQKLDAERERRRQAEDSRIPGANPAMGQLEGDPPWRS